MSAKARGRRPRKPQGLHRQAWWREQEARWLAAARTPEQFRNRQLLIEMWMEEAHEAFDLRKENVYAQRLSDHPQSSCGFLRAEGTPEFLNAYAAWCVAVDLWKGFALQDKWDRNRKFAILRNAILKRARERGRACRKAAAHVCRKPPASVCRKAAVRGAAVRGAARPWMKDHGP